MKVFIAMPFSGTDNIREAIRRAANSAGVRALFVDELSSPGRITDQIIEEIRTSDACVVDISNHNPNVLWEMGFSQAIGKEVILLSQRKEDFFFDAYDMRTILYDVSNLDALTQNLVSAFKSDGFKRNFTTPEQLVGTQNHKNTSLVLSAKGIPGTVYDFFKLIEKAKEHILIAGQNHRYLVLKGDLLKKTLLQFLKGGDNRKFDVLLCDKNYAPAVETWQYVLGVGEKYLGQLEDSDDFFQSLLDWSNENQVSRQIRITRIPFVPMSITFIDPELEEGLLVAVPNTYQSMNNIRPIFIISRKMNSDIFQNYWGIYLQKMDDF
jgi:hypothetical protein